MSFEPHYINTLIIYGSIIYFMTIGTVTIFNKLITNHLQKPVPP